MFLCWPVDIIKPQYFKNSRSGSSKLAAHLHGNPCWYNWYCVASNLLQGKYAPQFTAAEVVVKRGQEPASNHVVLYRNSNLIMRQTSCWTKHNMRCIVICCGCKLSMRQGMICCNPAGNLSSDIATDDCWAVLIRLLWSSSQLWKLSMSGYTG